MPAVKIFVSYHDRHPLLKSAVLQPIQTGCTLAPQLFKRMRRDDTGDNISADNPRYCELTAQYWVWKNYDKIGNPDYVGFMHYRRHFMFDGWSGNPDWCWLPKGQVYFVPYMTADYRQHFRDEAILSALQNCDCLVIKPYDVKNVGSKNIRTQFCKLPEQQPEIFDTFIAVAKELYPDWLPEIKHIEKGSVQYLCNMFVMKRELFFEYNKFCFDILREVDRRIDSSQMDEDAARFLGYLGEFLLSMFVFRLKKRKGIRIKELNAAYVLNDVQPDFSPLLYWKYKILSHITWGKKRARCRKKYLYWRSMKNSI